MAERPLQRGQSAWFASLESWLENERDQLSLWLPVMVGIGIASWFSLPTRQGWIAVILGGSAIALAGWAAGTSLRTGRVLIVAGLAISAGCSLAWARAEWVRSDVIDRPAIVRFRALVIRIEARPALGNQRVLLATDAESGLPNRIRVTVDEQHQIDGMTSGDRLSVRARLVPPPPAAIPGAYDFERTAWFQGIGATGKVIAPLIREGPGVHRSPGIRQRLAAHIQSRIEGSAGGIAAAFATGDRGAISDEDEEAMRASGLTHLLSVSGLHITAVVGGVFFLTLRLLAMFPVLALRWPLMLIAAAHGALAGIGYTLLTGAEVPTIRSCIAALLVLVALSLGREAMTLRLVAAGALIILCLWPEALIGASFQLSFAAITALVAFHEHPTIRALSQADIPGLPVRIVRGFLVLLATGIVVELALAPIALYHFHKSGLYGALANIVAIPLTTFIIMPLEALALILDLAGLGAPVWWLTGVGLEALLWLARIVATAPGAVAFLPSMPTAAFALMLVGGLWLLLWSRRPRWFGLPFLGAGAFWAYTTPAPDLLITGDGRHLAVRGDNGEVGILRERAGDYVRGVLADLSGKNEPLNILDTLPDSHCGRDLCTISLFRASKIWRIAGTRSPDRLPWKQFVEVCADMDIVVSDRALPRSCHPRWLKADRRLLSQTGGLALSLHPLRIDAVRRIRDDHPWVPDRRMPDKSSNNIDLPVGLPTEPGH